MITVTTTYAGNTALQETAFEMSVEDAITVRRYMGRFAILEPGMYWRNAFARPVSRAIREKRATVTVRTGGFSTGEFSNYVYNALGDHERSYVIDPDTDQRSMAR